MDNDNRKDNDKDKYKDNDKNFRIKNVLGIGPDMLGKIAK